MTAERAMRDALDGADQLRDGPLDRASVVLSLLSAAGWVVVPVVPTEAMDQAGHAALDAWDGDGDEGLHQTAVGHMWAAMLAAAERR